jgi:hypothetical protein
MDEPGTTLFQRVGLLKLLPQGLKRPWQFLHCKRKLALQPWEPFFSWGDKRLQPGKNCTAII